MTTCMIAAVVHDQNCFWCAAACVTSALSVQEFARLHLESHKKQFLKTADADYCL